MGISAHATVAALQSSAAFSPLSLSPFLWLDASDTATITNAGAGAVSQWNDKSGNARHMTQGTSGNRPLTGTTTQNSKNVIVFDGTDDFLATGDLTLPQPASFYIVAEVTTNTASDTSLMAGGNFAYYFARTASTYFWKSYSGANLNSSTANDLAVHQFTVLHNGASGDIRLDGASIASGNTSTASLTGAAGHVLTVGAAPAAAQPFTGFVAEMLAFSSSLASSDQLNLEAYLKAKWGTP